MSDETTAAPSAPSGESISIDQATAMLQAEPVKSEPAEKKQEAAQPVDQAEAVDTAPETDSGTEQAQDQSADSESDDTQDDQAASDEEQQAAPRIKPPASWDKDSQETFAKLPPELQEKVAAREKEREAFANTKAQEAAQARKEREQLLEFATKEVTQTLRMAQDAIEGEFAGIDWLALQASDPNTFLQLDALRKQRLDKIHGLQQQREALAQQHEHTQRAQAQATLQEEAQKVLPDLKRMIGESFTPESFRKDIGGYLEKQGVPSERVGMMSNGWELTISTKAMLYDKMQEAKAQATKKVASAPTVQKSNGRQMMADSGRSQKVQTLSTKLGKTGSIDDAVALLRAARGSR